MNDHVAGTKANFTGAGIGYLVGGIVLAILGALFQWKYFASKVDEDDDDYKKDGLDEDSSFWSFKK